MVKETAARPKVRMIEVSAGQEDQRLDNFLQGRLTGAPRALIYKIIRKGQVRVNGGRAKPSTRLSAGDVVRVPPVRLPQRDGVVIPGWALEAVGNAVIEEDQDALVIYKPHGMAVHGGSGMEWGLIDVVRELRKADTLELVHRLDRDTSGCLLIAKNKGAMRALQRQFREGGPDKRYLCLLDGCPERKHFAVDAPLLKVRVGGEHLVQVEPAGKPAKTVFTILESFRDSSLAEARLLTGRTHQIRAHAAHLGMPLAGDPRYLDSRRRDEWRSRGLRRLFLHACALVVEIPEGHPRSFASVLPEELEAVLRQLRHETVNA